MNYKLIGEEIRRLRLENGITQVKFVEDLSITQAELSRIEKGISSPNATTLFEIANKFGLDVNYFFNFVYDSQGDYLNGVYKDIRDEVKQKDYKEVFRLVRKHKNTPMFNGINEFKQFILWHEGICEYHVNNDPDKSLRLLNDALKVGGKGKIYWIENEIGILNSMGAVYYMIDDFEGAIECFEESLDLLYERPDAFKYYKLQIRLLFNLSKAYTRLKRFDDSDDTCFSGIDLCKEYDTMYLLAPFYLQLALNHEDDVDPLEYKSYLKKSREIFELQGMNNYLALIDNRLKGIKDKTEIKKSFDGLNP